MGVKVLTKAVCEFEKDFHKSKESTNASTFKEENTI